MIVGCGLRTLSRVSFEESVVALASKCRRYKETVSMKEELFRVAAGHDGARGSRPSRLLDGDRLSMASFERCWLEGRSW